MKVKSKKDDYTVKCKSQSETADVLNYINDDNDRNWSHWNYVSKHNGLYYDVNQSIPDRLNHLYVISFEEWQNLPDYDPKEVAFKDFVLPEKWFIKIDEENVEELNKYLHKNKSKYVGYSDGWKVKLSEEGFEEYTDYFYSESEKYPSHSSFLKREGFTEITFEQFKEHVLGEKTVLQKYEEFKKSITPFEGTKEEWENKFNKERKTIGYKLVKEEYRKAIQEILNDRFVSFDLLKLSDIHNSNIISVLEKSGVLSIWFEPVYENSTENKIMDFLAEQGIEINEECASEIIKIVNNK